MTPPIDQEEEEAKDRGFLEEALARPGGWVPGRSAVPRPQGGRAWKARAQRCAWAGHLSAAQAAPGGRVPQPPGGLIGPAKGTLASPPASAAVGSSSPRANFLELRYGEVRRILFPRTPVNSVGFAG